MPAYRSIGAFLLFRRGLGARRRFRGLGHASVIAIVMAFAAAGGAWAQIPVQDPPAVSPPAAGVPALPRYRLIDIKGPAATLTSGRSTVNMEWRAGEPGAVMRWQGPPGDVAAGVPQFMAAALTGVPSEIVLGEPVTFTIKAIRRHEYPEGNRVCRQRDWGGTPHPAGVRFGFNWRLGGTLLGNRDLRLFCEEVPPLADGGDPAEGAKAMAKQGEFSAAVRFVPTKVVRTKTGFPQRYSYRMEITSNAINTARLSGRESEVMEFNTERFAVDGDGFLLPGNRALAAAKKKRFYISVAPWGVEVGRNQVVFIYEPVTRDDPSVATVPPFVLPPVFREPTNFRRHAER